MIKKTVKKIATKDADQYMLRLPPGLRDQVARRAAENGRSMNTEIIDAIEKHLKDADRVTQLWDLFEQHRENLEAIPHIWGAVEELERDVQDRTGGLPGSLTEWTRIRAQPPITAAQVGAIRGLLKELEMDEAMFLRLLKVPSVEEIKDVNRAMNMLEYWRQRKNPPR